MAENSTSSVANVEKETEEGADTKVKEESLRPPEDIEGNVDRTLPSKNDPDYYKSSRKRISQGTQLVCLDGQYDIFNLPNNSGDLTYFPDPNLTEKSTMEVVAYWAEFTSVHGVYYMFERGHFTWWKQAVWSIIVIACTIGMIRTLVTMVEEFRQFSVNSSLKKINPSFLPFPEVTICNTNPYQVSKQNATGIEEPRNEEELIKISQPLEDFVIFTAFNNDVVLDSTGVGEEIFHNNATNASVWEPRITTFGLCYTFRTDRKVYRPGTSAGLRVWAWLDQDDYQDTTMEAGIRVFVTQQGTPQITDQTKQALVPSGAHAFLGISRVDYNRVTEEPWTNCKLKAPEYTNNVCRAQCIQNFTREACACRTMGDPIDEGLQYCTPETLAAVNFGVDDNNETQIPSPCGLFYNELGNLGDRSLEACGCDISPCKEEEYVVSFSNAVLADRITQALETSGNLPEGSFHANFVSLTINFEAIGYDVMEESKAKTFSSLISDLGGQLGFFMGISIISVVEVFVELIGLRLIPRFFGNKQLFGFGQLQKQKQD